ncbi:MAG: exodeoxyribonuclease VII small subunit [Oscillospiraceae bacterium]
MSGKMTIEGCLVRLEDINRKLASGEITVNDALSLYEEAASLLKACDELVKNAKLRLESADARVKGEADE